MGTPKVLLFDLGGVLVEGAGLRRLPHLLKTSLSAGDLRHKWVNSPAVARFETGRCSTEAFAAAFIAEWDLSLGGPAFIDEFRSWVQAPYSGTAQLLAALRPRYKLACLSNTNAVHWPQVLRMEGVTQALDHLFVSHEIGIMKPDTGIYRHVVRQLGCTPGEIAFFDDGPENVAAAAGCGLSAHVTDGPEQLRQVLEDLKVL